jgi:CBS domain-containing protein
MKVQDIMVKDVKTCHPETNLAEAARIMWANDIGSLPVVEGDGQAVGMITDRDIAIAVGTRNRAPAELTAFEVKPNPRELYACAPSDDLQDALKTMQAQGVRRLPVVNSGNLRGFLTLDDIALSAGKPGGASASDIADTLKAICEHRGARQTVAA